MLLMLLMVKISLAGDTKLPVSIHYIDSLYQTLSLEEKIKCVLVSPLEKEADTLFNWFELENLLEMDGLAKPMLSDVMVRSAFLSGNNQAFQEKFMRLLSQRKGDAVYFPMQSPYALMFQNSSNDGVDIFLEPIGKLAIPYLSADSIEYVYESFLYKMPKRIMSSHTLHIYTKLQQDLRVKEGNIKGAEWKDMQNVLQEYENPSLELILYQGGLIYSDNYNEDLSTLARLFQNDVLPSDLLERSCKKRLLIQELKAYNPSYDSYHSIAEEIKIVINELYRKGTVLLQNKQGIPLNQIHKRKIASIHIGVDGESEFQHTLSKYTQVDHFYLKDVPGTDDVLKLNRQMLEYNTIIVGVNGDWYEEEKNVSMYSFLHQISISADLILVHFGSGNRLVNLPSNNPFKAILLAFDTSNEAQKVAAQMVFGGIAAEGVLAKNINGHYSFGTGEKTKKCRLGYAPAYMEAIEDTLSLIDQIAYKAIRERATPGCQILVAKNGDVIYNKAFGYHTYSKKRHVKKTDFYDIASVTKIIASVSSVMRMYDEGKLTLDDSLSHLLPRLEGSNKESLLLKDMLIHQAGLESWIPFYTLTIDKERLKGEVYNRRYSSIYNIKLDTRLYMNKTAHYRSDIFRRSRSNDFSVRVCDDLYMNKAYLDSMQMIIDTSKVELDPEYKYSDLGYYYLKEIIEKTYRKPLNEYVEETFFKPIGAERMQYLPLEDFNKREIIPTENDKAFRGKVIHGYVHDPGAAMLGGVGGHAGIFANAQDLAKMLQMYLNRGIYGCERFIDSTTIETFTSVVKEGNRRGLGFDKPVLDPEISGPSCKEASSLSYGHSGFTGTLVWVDPKYDLIYIFLSNRIHPNQYNKQLIKTDVRTNIQSAIYRSLPEYWEGLKKDTVSNRN